MVSTLTIVAIQLKINHMHAMLNILNKSDISEVPNPANEKKVNFYITEVSSMSQHPYIREVPSHGE